MEDTVYDDLISIDFKKRPVIAGPHAVFRKVIAEAFHIAAQIILQPAEPLDHPGEIAGGKAFEVLFRPGFEFNEVSHGSMADQTAVGTWDHSL